MPDEDRVNVLPGHDGAISMDRTDLEIFFGEIINGKEDGRKMLLIKIHRHELPQFVWTLSEEVALIVRESIENYLRELKR